MQLDRFDRPANRRAVSERRFSSRASLRAETALDGCPWKPPRRSGSQCCRAALPRRSRKPPLRARVLLCSAQPVRTPRYGALRSLPHGGATPDARNRRLTHTTSHLPPPPHRPHPVSTQRKEQVRNMYIEYIQETSSTPTNHTLSRSYRVVNSAVRGAPIHSYLDQRAKPFRVSKLVKKNPRCP